MDSRWESDDLFSRLPDEMVHLIFNKLQDAQSLCVSLAVCRRFREIAPQANGIFLPVPLKKRAAAAAAAATGGESPTSLVKDAVVRTLMKSFSFISQMMKSKPKEEEESGADCSSYRVPCEVLKPFGEIRRLHIQLPCQENRSKTVGEPAGLLKWNAEFGQDFRSCVILGAKSWRPSAATDGDGDGERRVVMVDEELRLRIVWTISCLIAASTRHFLVGETVRGQQTVEDLVVSDESDQGKLCMNREMLEKMRESKVKDDGNTRGSASYRSKIPALRMKMWYLERLEVGGKVMEGATLVIIKPSVPEGKNGLGLDETTATAAAAFCEDTQAKAFGEAVRKLMVAKKCYTLEMNSF